MRQVFCVLSLFAIFLSGCTIKPEIDFTVPVQMPNGSVGTPYSYSFCEPDSARSGSVCGGSTPATNPTGGIPPYSIIYGNGSLPPGINLQLNGLLNGTPTLAGYYDFDICAKDGFGNQTCKFVTIIVKPKVKVEPITVDNHYLAVSAPICFDKPCKVSGKVIVSSTVPWRIQVTTGNASGQCFDPMVNSSTYWSICPISGGPGNTEVELSTSVFGLFTPDDYDELIQDRGAMWTIGSDETNASTTINVVLELDKYNS